MTLQIDFTMYKTNQNVALEGKAIQILRRKILSSTDHGVIGVFRGETVHLELDPDETFKS